MKKAFILVVLLLLSAGCTANQYPDVSPTVSSENSEIQTYSQEYLSSIVDEIMDYQVSHHNSGDKLADAIVGASINNGFVVVELTEVSDEIIALFRAEITDSEAVFFQKGEKYEELLSE